jgi:tripartite-type tricarboxylate transporter receptor subunit TctC
VSTVMAKPEMVKWAADQGAEIFLLDAEKFSPYLKSEIAKWTEVVDKADIHPT